MPAPAKPNSANSITLRSTPESSSGSGKSLEHLEWINDQLTIMAEAFELARKLLHEHGEIAARMAFKEKYTTLLASARVESRPVKWMISLGWDKADRVRALSDAVRKQQIQPAEAYGLLGPEAGE